MSERQKKTPDWMIERLALGELDAETAAAVRKRLADEGRSPDELLAAVGTSNREILTAHPAPAVAAEVRRRAQGNARWAWLVGTPVAIAGLAAVVLTVVFPGPLPTPVVDSQLESTTIKGDESVGPRLIVYRHDAGGARKLADGAQAARGDLLQLAFAGRPGGYFALLSLDGAGKVTVHWPEGGGRAPAVRDAGEIRLPSAYELDDAPAFERFFLVRSDAPFDVGPIAAAARGLAHRSGVRVAPLPLPLSFQQASLTLAKPGKEMP